MKTPFGCDRTYDVIIAGAGPAGCVLASRLSEEPNVQVLLIEAGPDPAVPGNVHPDVLSPFALRASSNSAFQWPGLIAETGADRGDGAACAIGPYVQGYGVGGASNINGMGVDRGLPADYDEWRDLGAESWSWAEVLPYFKKLEHDLDFSTDTALHGDSGPMPVRRLPRARWAPFAAALGEALLRRGFPLIEDYNTDFRDGLGAVPTNCLPDRRVSAPMAYLTREVRRRANLTLLVGAHVDQLVLKGRRATGVRISMSGRTSLIRGRQVIVSCGAIQSPTLLMRSGIGPHAHLAARGIEVVHALSGIGANLQNHPNVSLPVYLSRAAMQPADNVTFLQNWLRFSSHHPGCDPNDMHFMAFNKCAWHELGRRVGAVVVSVLKPYSKGSVELSSAAPAAQPRVQFNLLADSRDRERLVSGVRFVLELLTDPEVAQLRHQLFVPNDRLVESLSKHTGWNALKAQALASIMDRAPLRRMLLAKAAIDPATLLTDERSLRDLVRTRAQLQYHVCGTCRMGRVDDADAVVDSAGRVHGIEALRVVDASIFPTVPRGYTHFIVLMAAEKIADAIKADGRATYGFADKGHSASSVGRLHIGVEALEKNG